MKLAQYFAQEMKNGIWVTPDDLIDIAPELRVAMKSAGFQMFDLKQMPPHLLKALCKKYAPGKGFRTRCMKKAPKGTKDPAKYCNWLESLCVKKKHIPSRSVAAMQELEDAITKAVLRKVK